MTDRRMFSIRLTDRDRRNLALVASFLRRDNTDTIRELLHLKAEAIRAERRAARAARNQAPSQPAPTPVAPEGA